MIVFREKFKRFAPVGVAVILLLMIASSLTFSLYLDGDPQMKQLQPPHGITADEGYHPVRAPLLGGSDQQGSEKLSVIELFMYTCGHCHTVSSMVEEWSAAHADKASVTLVPVVFNDKHKDYLRLHYGLLRLGVEEAEVVKGIFHAVHEAKTRLSDRESFVALGALISGKSERAVLGAMLADDVESSTEKALLQFYKSGSNAVPTFVVGGTQRLDVNDYMSFDAVFSALSRTVNKPMGSD